MVRAAERLAKMGAATMQAEMTWTAIDADDRRRAEPRHGAQPPFLARRADEIRPLVSAPAAGGEPGRRQLGPPEVVRGCR
jgi:hypothetical protein